MKNKVLTFLLCIHFLSSCTSDKKKESSIQIQGTWRLVSSTIIDKGKSTFTDYTKGQAMIKIINDTHFAFLKHNLSPDKEGKYGFDAGGGKYTLTGGQYVESLDYYNDKNWEGKTFNFKVEIKNDTLIQTGIEKVEKAGVHRTITERYLRIKDN